MKQEHHKIYYLSLKRKKTITTKDIEEIVATIARIPSKSVTKNDKENLKEFKKRS